MYTRNLHSMIRESQTQRIVPTIGMGATINHYTDRDACTIIEVNAAKTQVRVQRDKVIRTDNNGQSDAQEYRYEPNDRGLTYAFSLRTNGRWVRVGDPKSGLGLSIGVREHFYDYSF